MKNGNARKPNSRFALLLLSASILFTGCAGTDNDAESTGNATESTAESRDNETVDEKAESGSESALQENVAEDEDMRDYSFQGSVSEEVLINYLSRAVTISVEGKTLDKDKTTYIKEFILNTGAKYIARAATCWNPGISDYDTYPAQKAFIDDVHESDPDVVFEACVFECISSQVNDIPIPSWVFEAFGEEPEERNFSFDKMCFGGKQFLNQWGEGTSVPDITKLETRMFLYYRACGYIDTGFEAIHMGQVHLIGRRDSNWKRWTELLAMIRSYASENARRGFVFINAHTHGITGNDGVLLFDFHMYPSRPMADGGQEAHFPSADNPQYATFKAGHSDSIYGDSLGGTTYSGWSCDSLPYLVELDNYGDDTASLNVPKPNDMRVWGMDEITWYANQPDDYRAEFLRYAYDWVKTESGGIGSFAMPGERVARYYSEDGSVTGWRYYAYDKSNFKSGSGDESVIKEIFAEN